MTIGGRNYDTSGVDINEFNKDRKDYTKINKFDVNKKDYLRKPKKYRKWHVFFLLIGIIIAGTVIEQLLLRGII